MTSPRKSAPVRTSRSSSTSSSTRSRGSSSGGRRKTKTVCVEVPVHEMMVAPRLVVVLERLRQMHGSLVAGEGQQSVPVNNDF